MGNYSFLNGCSVCGGISDLFIMLCQWTTGICWPSCPKQLLWPKRLHNILIRKILLKTEGLLSQMSVQLKLQVHYTGPFAYPKLTLALFVSFYRLGSSERREAGAADWQDRKSGWFSEFKGQWFLPCLMHCIWHWCLFSFPLLQSVTFKTTSRNLARAMCMKNLKLTVVIVLVCLVSTDSHDNWQDGYKLDTV